MVKKWKRRLGVLVLAVCVAAMAFPAFAAEDAVEIILTDVTATSSTVLPGEAKIMVSVQGGSGAVSIMQAAFAFTGDLQYKSIEFLQGENNPAEGSTLIYPNSALANATGSFAASIISVNEPLTFEDKTDLFILTFAGDAGASVSLSVNVDSTYCTVDGVKTPAAQSSSIDAVASEQANASKDAVVTLVMDQVTDFTAGGDGYQSSGIELKITSETLPGYALYTVLNNAPIRRAGTGKMKPFPRLPYPIRCLRTIPIRWKLTAWGIFPTGRRA